MIEMASYTKHGECPYGAESCPKVQELEDRVSRIERNQQRMSRILYYIAGIVSVSLGVTVAI